MKIERYLDAPTKLANTFVLHTGEYPIKEPVAEFNIAHDFKETLDANRFVYLRIVVNAGNLDDVIPIDFLCCVVQFFHNSILFCWCKYNTIFLFCNTFF